MSSEDFGVTSPSAPQLEAGVLHTPGPWEFKPAGAYEAFLQDMEYFVYAPGGYHVATIHNSMREVGSGLTEADALVVTAAPELLAFARAHEAWEAALIRHGRWELPGSEGLPALTDELYDAMIELQAKRNAAIAKASGQ